MITWRQFRTIVLRLAALGAVALLLDRALAFGLHTVLARSQWRYSVLYQGHAPADVLIIGNSRGVNGFYAPAAENALRQRVVNLSYNGFSLLLGEALARDWIDRHGRPRMIVAEVTSIRMPQSAIQDLTPYWNLSPRLAAIAAREVPQALLLSRVSRLFTCNGEMFLRALLYLRHSDQDWINRYQVAPSLIEETRRMTPATFQIVGENVSALRRLAAYCQSNQITLRLVVTPFLPGYVDHVQNYQPWLQQIAAAGQMPVWDYSNADADTTHFSDRLHANYQGAVPFMSRLVADGFFDPARTAPVAQSRLGPGTPTNP